MTNKIFKLVNEKFENILKPELIERFECFEANIEIVENLESRDGFIPFVDGFICLSSVISTDTLISTGNTPNYLGDYCNHIEKLAAEYSIEKTGDLDKRDDYYYEYLSDDYFYIEVNFYWYDKNGHGDNQNKIYFDYSIKDEYGKQLYKVNQKEIDEKCITDTTINSKNYVSIINNAINKIKQFI